MVNAAAENIYTLPNQLNINNLSNLYNKVLELDFSTINQINGNNVEIITTPIIQIILSMVKSSCDKDMQLKLVNISPVMRKVIEDLGISHSTIGMEE